MKQQLEQQQKQRMEARANAGPWEKLRSLIDGEGNFARAYIALSDHEKYAFGRPYTVRVPCFNEWAIEEPSSLKSKKGSSSNIVQKRPPYKVGNLELQLLYVPKPKGSKEEDMPKSMNACIREMREAENTASRMWEGFLSQQGGDCPVSLATHKLEVLSANGHKHSTGDDDFSGYRDPSSPHIMKLLDSHARPLIWPRLRNSSTISLLLLRKRRLPRAAEDESRPFRKRRKDICLLKRDSVFGSRMERSSTFTLTVAPKKRDG